MASSPEQSQATPTATSTSHQDVHLFHRSNQEAMEWLRDEQQKHPGPSHYFERAVLSIALDAIGTYSRSTGSWKQGDFDNCKKNFWSSQFDSKTDPPTLTEKVLTRLINRKIDSLYDSKYDLSLVVRRCREAFDHASDASATKVCDNYVVRPPILEASTGKQAFEIGLISLGSSQRSLLDKVLTESLNKLLAQTYVYRNDLPWASVPRRGGHLE